MEQPEGTLRFVLMPILVAQLLTGVSSSAGAQRGADTLMRGRSDSLGRFTVSGPYGEQYRIEVRRLGCLPIALRRAPAITRLDTPPRTWYNSERLHPH